MQREVTMEEISDGRLYGLNDMVKADCHDCEGCYDCCTGMGDTVVLDPLDVHRMAVSLRKTPEELVYGYLQLDVLDGNILPHLRMEKKLTGSSYASGQTESASETIADKEERCLFLNDQGRCSIHPFRPGLCRLFPLGRYYENGSFQYFLQIHECKKQNRSKIKVKKWIDTPDLKNYEQFIVDWHYFLKDVQEVLYHTEDTELIKNLNMYVISRFYLRPYDDTQDFYPQFYTRLQEARELLSLR